MNTLLANGEVPGLFEGDEFSTLMTQCKEGSQKEGLMLDSGEELYKWFNNQVSVAGSDKRWMNIANDVEGIWYDASVFVLFRW